MAVKMNFSFDAGVAEAIRQRAREQGKPASRYVSDLVERDARQAREDLAAAGYREVAAAAQEFAQAAGPTAAETWPDWHGSR
jgi:hypothetical protein